jgi:hypothetical protein
MVGRDFRLPKTDGTNLPPSVAEFLQDVGLPESEYLGFEFIALESALRPSSHFGFSEFWVIGSDGGSEICLGKGGEVLSVRGGNELVVRRLNSSVQKLRAFILKIEDARKKLAEMSEEDAVEMVQRLRDQLREADEFAFGSDEDWWPVVLEQMEQGLM